MKTIDLKSNKGISGADVAIGLILIVMFVGVIGTLLYKTYYNDTLIYEQAQATFVMTQILEDIDRLPFESVEDGEILAKSYMADPAPANETEAEKQQRLANKLDPDKYTLEIQSHSYGQYKKILQVKITYKVLQDTYSFGVDKVKYREY